MRLHGKIEKSMPPCPIGFPKDGVECLKAEIHLNRYHRKMRRMIWQ